jgi:hypothetical protein
MPIHDGSRVEAGLFHHFHQRWIAALSDALSTGLLPQGYSALVEQAAAGPIPDIRTLQRPARPGRQTGAAAGGTVVAARPQARHVQRVAIDPYAAKANRIAIRHRLGQVVAIVVLPDMPPFLEPEVYVPTPLESTYETSWSVCPADFREAVLGRTPPETD